MAHFAKVDKNTNVVVDVVVMGDQVMLDANGNEVEQLGIDYLNEVLTDEYLWVQTSYNTKKGQHLNNGTPLRKNYAGIGFTYDAERDAFIPPKRHPDDVLDPQTCTWVQTNTQSESRQSYQIQSGETPHN